MLDILDNSLKALQVINPSVLIGAPPSFLYKSFSGELPLNVNSERLYLSQ